MYAAFLCKATLVQERLNIETIDRNFVNTRNGIVDLV